MVRIRPLTSDSEVAPVDQHGAPCSVPFRRTAMGGQRPVSGAQSNFRIWQTASFKQLGRVTAFQPKGDIHAKVLSRQTYRQPRSGCVSLKLRTPWIFVHQSAKPST